MSSSQEQDPSDPIVSTKQENPKMNISQSTFKRIREEGDYILAAQRELFLELDKMVHLTDEEYFKGVLALFDKLENKYHELRTEVVHLAWGNNVLVKSSDRVYTRLRRDDV